MEIFIAKLATPDVIFISNQIKADEKKPHKGVWIIRTGPIRPETVEPP